MEVRGGYRLPLGISLFQYLLHPLEMKTNSLIRTFPESPPLGPGYVLREKEALCTVIPVARQPTPRRQQILLFEFMPYL